MWKRLAFPQKQINQLLNNQISWNLIVFLHHCNGRCQIFFENLLPNRRFGVEITLSELFPRSTTIINYYNIFLQSSKYLKITKPGAVSLNNHLYKYSDRRGDLWSPAGERSSPLRAYWILMQVISLMRQPLDFAKQKTEGEKTIVSD